MYLQKNSRYRICPYILWLTVLIFLMVSVECNNTNNSDVCTTPGCEAAAYIIKNSINATQDPCKNFYNFACGNFKKSLKIPQGYSEIGTFSLVRDAVKKNLTEALMENIDPNEPRIFKSVKNYYKACMDVETIDNKGLEPLKELIEYLGGWPMTYNGTWNETNFDWMKTVHKLRQLGYRHDYIVGMNVVLDENDSSKFLLEIREAPTFLNAEIYRAGWSNPTYQAYVKYIVDIALLLGAPNEQVAHWHAFDIVYLESYLSLYADEVNTNVTVESIEDIEKYYNTMVYNGTSIPKIPWLEYINNITSPVVNFTATDKVKIVKPKYIMNLPEILQFNKREVASYLIWRAIADSAQFMSKQMRTIHDSFHNIYSDGDSRKWHCLELLYDKSRGIPVGADALYVRKYANNVNDKREDLNNLMKNMADQLDFYINQLTWLDDETRNGALEKARSRENITGFPDELYNHITEDSFSLNLDINSNNHLQNILNTQRFNFEKGISRLHNFTNNLYDSYSTSYTEVNAYYFSYMNRMVINDALMLSPIYSLDWPNYMKYGAIGHHIGHEMMHAYDNLTLFIDATINNQWYTNESALKYQEKMKCFVQHYENYYIKNSDLKVDGSRTLNENLADYGGTILAYSGYKKWVAENGNELPLPGLDYTPEQIFWIMLANSECSKSNWDYKNNIVLSDTHTLEKFRVFGIMKNSKDFANDFNCPIGSKMNPEEKCSLAK